MGDQALFPTRDDFDRTFDPRVYLEENFNGLDDEDEFAYQFICSALRPLGSQMLIHEFGGGPALYSVAALAAKAREIHFSDAVEASLAEVKKWIRAEPGGFDWKPYIRLSLEHEGLDATPEAVLSREADMRRLLTRLMICDAQSAQPLGPGALQYDLVAAHHCTDVAATNREEWFQVLRNVTTLVRPGGYLMLSITTGTKHYTVGKKVFRCADLQKSDLIQGYLQAGYEPQSIRLDTHQVGGTNREYTGIISAIARRCMPTEGV